MTYIEPPNFFDVGIFAETLTKMDMFGANIYLTQMLSSSVAHYSRLQTEYELAVVEQDEDLIQQKKIELKICEGNFAMATALFDAWETDYS